MTEINNFMKICRTCNNEKTNLLNLFAVDSDSEPTLGEKLKSCTSLNIIENDNLPQNICYPCAKLLEEAYKFNRMCFNTDSSLRKRLPVIVVESKTTEILSDSQDSQAEKTEDSEVDNFCESPVFLEHIEDDGDNTAETNTSVKQEILSEIEVLEGEEDIPAVVKIHCSNISTANDRKEVPQDSSDRPFTCNDCDKKFFTSKALELHVKVHHKKTTEKNKLQISKLLQTQTCQDKCTECDLIFENRMEYKEHLLHNHLNESADNTCGVCGKRLRNKIALKNHLRVHEAENRPYVCNVCGKEYTEYRHMYMHMLYHKPTLFRCPEESCPREYTVKHKLVDHLRRHHGKILTNIEVRKIQPESIEENSEDDEKDD